MRLSNFLVGAAITASAKRTPLFVYVDEWTHYGQEVADELVRLAKAGASHILLAFHMVDNPNFPNHVADSVLAWYNLTSTQREETVKTLHQLGTRLIMSSGGETEYLNWLNHDPAAYAADACKQAKDLGFDGFDFDKEGFSWMTQQIMDWTNAATKKCREVFPEAVITGAPQPPHFSEAVSAPKYGDGLKLGAPMDHYLIQYYNQGTWNEYNTYDRIFTEHGSGSIADMRKFYPNAGKNVFVVGKPYLHSHAGAGHMELGALREAICRAERELGYTAGTMFWKHPWGQDLSQLTRFAEPCDGSPLTFDPLPGSGTAPTPAPTTTTTEATTTQAQTTATPSAAVAAVVQACEDKITSADAIWGLPCRQACTLFTTSAAPYCPRGTLHASTLVSCVLKQNSKCTLTDL